MRVATITTFNQATYQLNRLSSDLTEANRKVTTGLRINSCSDDPTGTAQVLDINSSLTSLEQYQVNIQQGQNQLSTVETSLNTTADILTDLKLDCSGLANASASPQERADAAESVAIYREQLMDLANTEVYGGYIFAGEESQSPPFVYDDPDNPTCVEYQGSQTPNGVKTGPDTVMPLDCCGCDIYYEDAIVVDGTNNQIVFTEDPGTGAEHVTTIETTIPSGTYTREELAEAVEDAMRKASVEEGNGVGYEISYDEGANTFGLDTDGKEAAGMSVSLEAVHEDTVRASSLEISGGDYPKAEIEVRHPDAMTHLTPEPEGSEPLMLTYTEDGNWTVENDPGYGFPSEIPGDGARLELDVDENGTADLIIDLNEEPEPGTMVSFDLVQGYENNSVLPDLGFDDETIGLETIQSDHAVAETFTVVAGQNDTIDFTETGANGNSGQLTAVIEPGSYNSPESYAAAVEDALEEASAESGNRVNYQVTYLPETQSFDIREDTDTGQRLDSFELLFESGTHSMDSAASDLGFEARDCHAGPVRGESADWGIFDTLFDLEEALATNDVDGIQRAMTRLDNHYESITSSISTVGSAYDDLGSRGTTASESSDTLTTQRAEIQDADYVAAVMDLEATQTTYEAALNSTASIMELSLVNYM